MMESMIKNPRPTRAEVTDIANAIFDGSDAIMLSGETAIGAYPVETVTTMASVAKRAEEVFRYNKTINNNGKESISITCAISYAGSSVARDLGASVIITPTQSGTTARMVSKYRPLAPIIAATPKIRVARELSLSFGVEPVLIEPTESTDEIIKASVNKALKSGYIKAGDLIVITAGIPVGTVGTTNMIKVHIVDESER